MASKGLSKENLKNELIAHNVPLPASGSKKEKYVELYEKHVSSKSRSEFSSDEEEAASSPKVKVRRSILTSSMESNKGTEEHTIDGVNISQLSDDELRQLLLDYKLTVGPIVESTRSVYERQLSRALRGDIEGEHPSSVAEADYSDNEEDLDLLKPINRNSTPRKELRSDHQLNETPISKEEPVQENMKRFEYTRDTPTPRRSLRPNFTYTITERKPTNSFSRDHFISGRHDDVGKLASTVVEQIQEPVLPKRSKYSTLVVIILSVIIVVIGLLVYQNMEANGIESIKELPGTEGKR